jgi:hypothetical protein
LRLPPIAISPPSTAFANGFPRKTTPEGAKRFYAEVFGWETESFAVGDAEMTLWKVPGYVGGEPQQPVSREVIATMGPAGENGEASPDWASTSGSPMSTRPSTERPSVERGSWPAPTRSQEWARGGPISLIPRAQASP